MITLGAAQALDTIKAKSAAGRDDVKVGTFDLNADAAKAVQAGTLQFCIDQQPYLQGYLAVEQLYLYKKNGNVMGGGKATLTGPVVRRQHATSRRSCPSSTRTPASRTRGRWPGSHAPGHRSPTPRS